MSHFVFKCSFCDSADPRVRSRTRIIWEEISKTVSRYFSSFTYDHFIKLCDSCFTYTEEFCKCRKLWLINEAQIHKKRMLGQFKGLNDIVNLKKKSFHICRLCFGGSPLEEVIFIYHENKIYQPGYIRNMLNLHADNIDLSMTENPVICQGCLDGIQTFDALYQMCLENQASKSEPDLKVRCSSDTQGSIENETEKIVHVQLKKNIDNSLVLHSVTEAESAVNNLMSSKEGFEGPVIMNGWTTKKVIDMVQNAKTTVVNKIKNQDLCDGNQLEHKTPTTESRKNFNNNKVHNKTELNDHTIENEESTHLTKLLDGPKKSKLDTQSSESVIIEIEDSDEEEEIVIPSILNITTVNEAEEATELQMQMDPVSTEDDQEIEAIPRAEINMTAVSRLFSSNETESEVEPLLKEYSNPETDIEGSGATSVDDSSDSSTSHFNKEKDINTTSNCLKRSNESRNIDEACKKVRTETTDLNTYSSAYERFIQHGSEKHAGVALLPTNENTT